VREVARAHLVGTDGYRNRADGGEVGFAGRYGFGATAPG
jgi:hypothetical protein